MKLSEAIRLGAMLHPQAFRVFQRTKFHADDASVVVTATCALGAAKEAGYQGRLHMDMKLGPQSCVVADCQYGRRRRLFLASWIAHFNDAHKWPRERIADWVATVEDRAAGASSTGDQHEPAPAVAAVPLTEETAVAVHAR